MVKKYKFNEIEYELTENYKDGFDKDAVDALITDYFDNYDYIFGDWSYGKLRLKGFCEKTNKICNDTNNIELLDEYIKNLTGEKISKLLNNAKNEKVLTKMPKFEYDYSADITEMLMNMGIKAAFDSNNAGLTGIGTWEYGNLYIGKVLHKTYISVAEKGTRAGAVTAELLCACLLSISLAYASHQTPC